MWKCVCDKKKLWADNTTAAWDYIDCFHIITRSKHKHNTLMRANKRMNTGRIMNEQQVKNEEHTCN